MRKSMKKIAILSIALATCLSLQSSVFADDSNADDTDTSSSSNTALIVGGVAAAGAAGALALLYNHDHKPPPCPNCGPSQRNADVPGVKIVTDFHSNNENPMVYFFHGDYYRALSLKSGAQTLGNKTEIRDLFEEIPTTETITNVSNSFSGEYIYIFTIDSNGNRHVHTHSWTQGGKGSPDIDVTIDAHGFDKASQAIREDGYGPFFGDDTGVPPGQNSGLLGYYYFSDPHTIAFHSEIPTSKMFVINGSKGMVYNDATVTHPALSNWFAKMADGTDVYKYWDKILPCTDSVCPFAAFEQDPASQNNTIFVAHGTKYLEYNISTKHPSVSVPIQGYLKDIGVRAAPADATLMDMFVDIPSEDFQRVGSITSVTFNDGTLSPNTEFALDDPQGKPEFTLGNVQQQQVLPYGSCITITNTSPFNSNVQLEVTGAANGEHELEINQVPPFFKARYCIDSDQRPPISTFDGTTLKVVSSLTNPYFNVTVQGFYANNGQPVGANKDKYDVFTNAQKTQVVTALQSINDVLNNQAEKLRTQVIANNKDRGVAIDTIDQAIDHLRVVNSQWPKLGFALSEGDHVTFDQKAGDVSLIGIPKKDFPATTTAAKAKLAGDITKGITMLTGIGNDLRIGTAIREVIDPPHKHGTVQSDSISK